MPDKKAPSLDHVIEQLLAQLHEPIHIDDFAHRVLAVHPSQAKHPLTALRSKLRQEHVGRTLVFLDNHTLVPLPVAMHGVRFRIPLTPQEVTQGALLIYPAFAYFQRQEIAPQDVQLVDAAGRPLEVRVVTLKQPLSGPFKSFRPNVEAFDLGDWFRSQNVKRHDSLLVTVEDWQAGRFRLQHEPVKARRQEEIARQNQELTDVLFAMLEAARAEQLYAHQAIPTAYARLSHGPDYPGDHWLAVLASDGRMDWDGFAIRYRESSDLFSDMLGIATLTPPKSAAKRPAPEQTRQVYRFLATLRHQKDLWRRIDIQGGQLLVHFDRILRQAFRHDTGDHLAGFWKLVRRGTGQRFREVDLGSIDPFGEGEGAEHALASLGLQPGDAMKYVYDFGDWIEHRLTLEEIVPPEASVTYPRIVDQNKPRYRYCQTCKEQERQVVATWMCVECSNIQHRQVLVCDTCMASDHEDHYVDEMLY